MFVYKIREDNNRILKLAPSNLRRQVPATMADEIAATEHVETTTVRTGGSENSTDSYKVDGQITGFNRDQDLDTARDSNRSQGRVTDSNRSHDQRDQGEGFSPPVIVDFNSRSPT